MTETGIKTWSELAERVHELEEEKSYLRVMLKQVIEFDARSSEVNLPGDFKTKANQILHQTRD